MPDKAFILSALRKLAACYGKQPTRAQTDVYLEMLADVEPAALDYAVNSWIRQSPFFPRINELLRIASQYHKPASSPSHYLYQKQFLLEQIFTSEGKLDSQAWEELAQRFELFGMTYSASYCRDRYQQRKTYLELKKDPQAYAKYVAENRLKWREQGLPQESPARKDLTEK